jgi:hypothetical protein
LQQGRWQLYFSTVVSLADQHTVRLPPGRKIGPTRFEELPADWQQRLKQEKGWPPANAARARGKWPDYALVANRVFIGEKKRPPRTPLGPARAQEFTPTVERFIKETLQPVLTNEEQLLLTRVTGHWPNFPNQVLRLAREHKLHVPGMTLPGAPTVWQPFRTQLRAALPKND